MTIDLMKLKFDDLIYAPGESCKHECLEELKKVISEVEPEYKKAVLDYMNNGVLMACGPAYIQDPITGEIDRDTSDNLETDGVYYWSTFDTMMFEKYNLKLSDDFIQHVLSQSKNK